MAVAWTTIPNTDVDPDSPVTTSLMTALRDNPQAIAEGAASAPRVVEAGLAAAVQGKLVTNGNTHDHNGGDGNPIAQGALKTALQQTYVFVNSGTPYTITYTGGTWNLLGGFAVSNFNNTNFYLHPVYSAAYQNQLVFYSSTTAGYLRFQSRYIQASPPYDFGDGVVPLFVFVLIEKTTNKIIAVDIAADPPWANNGPTNIRPDFYKNGQPMQYIRPRVDILNKAARAQALKELEDHRRGVKRLPTRAITTAFKNSDMAVVPHPFIGTYDSAKHVIVMPDPVSNMMGHLSDLYDAGEDVSKIVADKNLVLGNTPLQRKMPPDVMPVSIRWKQTI